MSPRVRFFPAAVAWSLVACFQDFSTAPEPASRLLEHVSPAFAEGPAGSVVTSPTVRVVERVSGKPIPNVEVEFLPRPQSGSIANVVTRTGAERDQARSPDNGRLRVDMTRWFPASSTWFTQTWMFREIES